MTERIERVFLDRARRLSDDAQTLLLVASADDSTRLATVLRAAAALGSTRARWTSSRVRSGLVDGDRLSCDTRWSARRCTRRPRATTAAASMPRWPQPSTARRTPTAGPGTAPPRWSNRTSRSSPTWWRPERAGRRGGHEAASAAWERAAELSTDPDQRARYLFAASMAAWASAHPDRARDLIEKAIAEAGDPLLLADARRLRGRIEWNTGSVKLANRMLLEAAVDAAEPRPGPGPRARGGGGAIAPWGGDSGSSIDAPRWSRRPRPMLQPASGLRPADARRRPCRAGDYAAAAPPFRSAFAIHEELPEDYELLPNLSIARSTSASSTAPGYMNRLLTAPATMVPRSWCCTR